MMPHNSPAQHLFAVTTSGLSATRWLAHVLASHPDVFVAHGKHALDSIQRGDFGKERGSSDIDSLVTGNDLQDFYDSHSLEQVFAHYQETKPAARAHGCVHSYTVDTLVRSARNPQSLAGIRIVNLLRHPIRYIASHHALVRSAEKHPRLYQHYVERVFPQALREYPELFLLECPDSRDFLAFAVSCLGVANWIRDLSYPGIQSVQMEVLTRQVDALRELCEQLTGLSYAPEALGQFIDQGAINRHRATAHNDSHGIFDSWQPWQQDMACLMMPAMVLECLETLGYDLSMFRAPPCRAASSDSQRGLGASLVDQLRTMDPRHPLLHLLENPGPTEIQQLDTELRGFHLIRHADKFYALANALGSHDLGRIGPEMARPLKRRGAYVVADSIQDLWTAIAGAMRLTPRLVQEGYRGFNLVEQRGRLWAFSHVLGPLDLVHLNSCELERMIENQDCLVADDIDKLKQAIDELAIWRAAEQRAAQADQRLCDPQAVAQSNDSGKHADPQDRGEVMKCNLQLLINHPKPRAKVSVILVDWGVRESFHSVRYLAKQTVPRDQYEVIWVEFYDRKPKELAQLAKQTGMLDKWLIMGYPEGVHYHKHRMYNAGILLSEGAICVICDSDAMFTPTFIEHLQQAFAEDPKRAVHVDEVRNYSKSFYPFNYPTVARVLGAGCVNWTGSTTTGLAHHPDMIHSANYGACMAARRDDLIRIGGADEHLDYLGYICGPYELTFRLAHFGHSEHWLRNEYLYHVWHPNTSGCNIEYRGPDDGMGVSLRALRARDTGRIAPYLENAAMRRLRLGTEESGAALLPLLVRDDDRSWHKLAAHAELSRPPQLVEEDVRGFNIFVYRGVWYALPKACGLLQPLKVQNQEYSQCYSAGSLADIMNVLNGFPQHACAEPQPDLIEEGYLGFNIIQYHDLWYGLAQEEGEFLIAKAKSGGYRRCIPGASLSAVKASIRRQRNFKRVRDMVAGVISPVRKIASLARR